MLIIPEGTQERLLDACVHAIMTTASGWRTYEALSS